MEAVMNIACEQVTLTMRLGLMGQAKLPFQVDKTVMSLLVTIQGPISTALLLDPFGKYLTSKKLIYRTSTTVVVTNDRASWPLGTSPLLTRGSKSKVQHWYLF